MKKLFLFLVIFTIFLSGCDIQDKMGFKQKNPQNTAEIAPKKISEIHKIKKDFTIKDIKFLLAIPDDFTVGDYSKTFSGINVIDQKTKRSLHVIIEELGNRTFEDIKNEFLNNGDGDVRVQALPWRQQGYELVFQSRDEDKDYMVVIARTFLLPVKNHYFVVNEIVESPKDYSLSPAIKSIADSLEIL